MLGSVFLRSYYPTAFNSKQMEMEKNSISLHEYHDGSNNFLAIYIQ